MTSNRRHDSIFAAAKTAIPALALAAGLATAAGAHAEAIWLGSRTYSTANTAVLGGPVNYNVYLTPQVYTANYGVAPGAPTFDLLVFCVDVFHFSGVNLPYETAAFIDNSASNISYFDALDGAERDQVGYLTNYGAKLYALNALGNVDKLAAVQGAIWKVVNSDTTPAFTIDASKNSVDTLIATLSGAGYLAAINGDVGPVSKNIKFIRETRTAAHQAFVFASAPEPGTWALMIGGFGLAGMALRRRQAAPAR